MKIAQENRGFIPLIKEIIQEVRHDNITSWSAAVAYFTIFSLPPVIILTITIAGNFFRNGVAEGRVYRQVQNLVGSNTADVVQAIVENAAQISQNVPAAVLSIALLLYGASGALEQVRLALADMWQAKGEKRPGFIGLILYRLISVVLVSVVSILFIVSFSLSAFINTATELIRDIFPVPGFLLESTNFVLTAFGTTLIFSIIYIFLIEAKVRLKDILAGSAVAAFLFTLEKTLISFYLGFSNILTLFGAASSFIALLILIYYSVQFFFIGAEVVKVLHKKNKRR